jgi:hypothetical protein
VTRATSLLPRVVIKQRMHIIKDKRTEMYLTFKDASEEKEYASWFLSASFLAVLVVLILFVLSIRTLSSGAGYGQYS